MGLKRLAFSKFKDILPNNLLFYRGNENSKQIALTFDDGPYPGGTEKILNILRKHKIKATFFMNGIAIEQNKDIVIKVLNDGHEIGNHFYNHRDTTYLKYKELKKEIEGWEDVVKEIAPNDRLLKLLRPPYGRLNLKILWYATMNHWRIILWSVDTKDLENISLKEKIKMLEAVLIRGEDIILFHEDAKHIGEMIEWIIKKIKSKGLTFCKVSDLLEKENGGYK